MGPAVAFLDATDAERPWVTRELSDFGGQLHTTTAVVAEVRHFAASRRGGPGLFAEFLRSTSAALLEMPEVAKVVRVTGTAEIGSVSPAVLRYEQFADLLHPAGVARLGDAAEAVARFCKLRLEVVPTAQEVEWLISVAAQEPVAELAERNSTSVRGMYRLLEAMWSRLGVNNQVQGVALAVQQGWIAPTPAEVRDS